MGFLAYLKSEWKEETSAIWSLFWFPVWIYIDRETLSIFLKLGLKLSLLVKLIVRGGPVNAKPPLSYAARALIHELS